MITIIMWPLPYLFKMSIYFTNNTKVSAKHNGEKKSYSISSIVYRNQFNRLSRFEDEER